MDDIVITTEEQNEAALAELEELLENEKPTDREQGYIDRLTAAIEKFEEEHYPMPEPTDREKELIADALGHDPVKAKKAMKELNWHDMGDED
jgi:hypothetical protein